MWQCCVYRDLSTSQRHILRLVVCRCSVIVECTATGFKDHSQFENGYSQLTQRQSRAQQRQQYSKLLYVLYSTTKPLCLSLHRLIYVPDGSQGEMGEKWIGDDVPDLIHDCISFVFPIQSNITGSSLTPRSVRSLIMLWMIQRKCCSCDSHCHRFKM